ncbi:MAG: hypothetical protein L0G18_19315, partial [Pseudomonas sp.]|nr:hypothetical protein [Pseudomonas sp.]
NRNEGKTDKRARGNIQVTEGHRAALRSSVCVHPCRETIRQRQRAAQTLVTTVVVVVWAYA